MAVLAFKEKDGTINMLVSGPVGRDPELKETKNGDKVRFSVAYGKKKFQNVEAYADSPQGRLAGCLEKGDRVEVTGIWETWEHDGHSYDVLRADFISVQMDAPSAPENVSDESTGASSEDNAYSELQDADEELPF